MQKRQILKELGRAHPLSCWVEAGGCLPSLRTICTSQCLLAAPPWAAALSQAQGQDKAAPAAALTSFLYSAIFRIPFCLLTILLYKGVKNLNFSSLSHNLLEQILLDKASLQ